jgi:hypothetical protein
VEWRRSDLEAESDEEQRDPGEQHRAVAESVLRDRRADRCEVRRSRRTVHERNAVEQECCREGA